MDIISSLLPVVLPLGFFLLMIVVVLALYFYNRKKERERTEQLRSTATMLGWQFADTATFNWIPNLETFPLFSSGHSKAIKNMMYGEINGIKAALFDYQYVVGYGKNQTTYNQSVSYFEPRNLNLPSFTLRQENFFHKIGTAFGYQDIDFGNRPLFSKKYLLRGQDEQAIRNVFTDEILNFYEANQGTSTDGGGNQLFIFRMSHRATPQESKALIDSTAALAQLFVKRW